MGISTTNLLIILLIIVLLFGASRIPELGKGLGQGLRSFRDAMKGNDESSAKAHKTAEADTGAKDQNKSTS